MVALFATLSACASAPADNPGLTGPAPAPVIETRTERVVVCPDEIWRDLGEDPEPPADASVTWNDAARAWADEKFDLLADALAALAGARKACEAQGVNQP